MLRGSMSIPRLFGGFVCSVSCIKPLPKPAGTADSPSCYRRPQADLMSAEAALNKSLDDLIAEQRQKKPQASQELDRQAHLALPVSAAPRNYVHPPFLVAEEGDPQRKQAGSPGPRPSARLRRGPAPRAAAQPVHHRQGRRGQVTGETAIGDTIAACLLWCTAAVAPANLDLTAPLFPPLAACCSIARA